MNVCAESGGLGAVMIVAMLDAENVVLVEEYCAGSETYSCHCLKA